MELYASGELPLTKKRPSEDRLCGHSTTSDSQTSPHAQNAVKVARARVTYPWRDLIDPVRDPDVVEGQYYTATVRLSMDSLNMVTLEAADGTSRASSPSLFASTRRSRPSSPLARPRPGLDAE